MLPSIFPNDCTPYSTPKARPWRLAGACNVASVFMTGSTALRAEIERETRTLWQNRVMKPPVARLSENANGKSSIGSSKSIKASAVPPNRFSRVGTAPTVTVARSEEKKRTTP